MVEDAQADQETRGGSLSNTQLALKTIKQLILENKLPPGSNHLESELGEMLGMSRTPVREATLILEAQGLLEVRPRHGVKISSLSANDVREIYQILTELESLAVELAAKRDIPEDDFAEVEKAIHDMEEALKTDNREAWAQADERFHRELVRLGRNSRISTMVATCNDQVQRVRILTLYMRPSPTVSNEEHRNVVDAIRNHDAARARVLHSAHREQAGKLLISILETHRLHSV